MDDKDLSVAIIVSAIIAKSEVTVGVDGKYGVAVRVRKTTETKEDCRGDNMLEDLVKSVRKALQA